MNPIVKYGLGRLGIFVVVAVPALLVLPAGMNLFLKLLLAFAVSALLGYVLLRRWRDEAAARIGHGQQRRARQRERLRAALAGEPDQTPAVDQTPALDDLPDQGSQAR